MKQQGNVLFLILIAVALFAALSYAVTKSSRGGSGNASKEKAELTASEILQYMSSVQQAIVRMRVSSGCSDTDISFETPLMGYNYTHSPVVKDACKVFSTKGGGVAYREPKNWFDTANLSPTYPFYVTGSMSVGWIGSSANELLLFFTPLNKDVCEAIDKSLGIDVSAGVPAFAAVVAAGAITEFKGVYGTPTTAADSINNIFRGKARGCYKDPANYYGYYQAFIER